MTRILWCAVLGLALAGCSSGSEAVPEDEALGIGTQPCKGQPAFISSTGLPPARAAFSTSELRVRSLAMVDATAPAAVRTPYIHPSWPQWGPMGPITLDREGAAYVAAVPVIDVIGRTGREQRTIYKVDPRTGTMAPFLTVPGPDAVLRENPYGLLGLFYDCFSGKLYATSVAGSTRRAERGRIYCIQPATGAVEDSLETTDPMGVAICGTGGKYHLYFGAARTGDVWAVELDREGHFRGEPAVAFSIAGLGPRGDDKPRRIRVEKDGSLTVAGIEFNYNLTAPTEKIETTYRARWSEADGNWIVEM